MYLTDLFEVCKQLLYALSQSGIQRRKVIIEPQVTDALVSFQIEFKCMLMHSYQPLIKGHLGGKFKLLNWISESDQKDQLNFVNQFYKLGSGL